MSQRKLTRNAIKCLLCDDVIESKHRHDWVPCKCGAAFVDGGLDYVRYGAVAWDQIQDLCEYTDTDEEL